MFICRFKSRLGDQLTAVPISNASVGTYGSLDGAIARRSRGLTITICVERGHIR